MDQGVVVHPVIVEGQVHGGAAQGIGQALYEDIIYDENGQLLSGSLMDYALPTAEMMPEFISEFIETPSPTNPLGVKGHGRGTDDRARRLPWSTQLLTRSPRSTFVTSRCR